MLLRTGTVLVHRRGTRVRVRPGGSVPDARSRCVDQHAALRSEQARRRRERARFYKFTIQNSRELNGSRARAPRAPAP